MKYFLFLLLLCCHSLLQAQTDTSGNKNSVVEVEASYPGGDEAWKNFLAKNIHTNVTDKNNAPAGIYPVVVKFIVGTDGNLKSIAGETNFGYGMEDEVIRVIEKSVTWKPALQNGRKVNAYRRQPITFKVETKSFTLNTATPFTFFTGQENELSVAVPGVKGDNINVTISKGSIKQIAEGKYIVKVTQPGRVIIEVFNTKKDKSLGMASFEVKESK